MSRVSQTRTVNRTTARAFHVRYVPVFIAYLLVGSASVADAQDATPLREANRIYETGDIDGALIAYEGALQAPRNAARDVLHIHRRLGLLRAATGDIEAARGHFAIAIAMAPDTPASGELSPQLRDYWEETRASQEPIDLQVEPRGTVTNQGVTEIEIAVLNTPEGVVASMRASVGAGGDPAWESSIDGVGPSTFEVPASAWGEGRRVQVRVEALDLYGGIIAESRTSLNASATAVGAGPVVVAPERESSNSLPWIIAGSGAALIVAGSITGILTLGQQSSLESSCPDGLCPPQIALDSEQSSVQTMALVTDILLLTGVAAAATGVTMLLLQGGDANESESNVSPTSVGVVCAPTGCAASATVRF